jgi:Sugar (and other) transporter
MLRDVSPFNSLAPRAEAQKSVSWGSMLSGTNGKLVLVACFLFVIQQGSGINAIVYFSTQARPLLLAPPMC